ncbi:TlpA family protein disulfide reductase [Undibacterium sp. Xuan67W]|uniref:TlpA family protein disulfide reductase n=1 Tax=Undibacterium sp. Xuan67W TaxID=3413057 RepID=UPI003BF0BA46
MNKKSLYKSLSICAGLLLASHVWAIEKNNVAPSFELNGTDGVIKLAKYQGKLIYLDFWASWCGPCKQSFPWMNELQAKYGAQGLQVIGINLDVKNEDARQFLAIMPAHFPIAFDPSGVTPRIYGIKGMPSSVLISQEGKVLFEHAGFKDSDKPELEGKIKSLLEGKK